MIKAGTGRFAAVLLLVGIAVVVLWLGCAVNSTPEDTDTGAADVTQCMQVELRASRNYKPDSFRDAQQTFSAPLKAGIPKFLPVTAGNAGSSGATLTFRRLPDKKLIRCHYSGQAHDNHPTDLDDTDRGRLYTADWCDFDAKAGDVVSTDILKLHLEGGDCDDPARRTEVALTIVDASCRAPVPDNGKYAVDITWDPALLGRLAIRTGSLGATITTQRKKALEVTFVAIGFGQRRPAASVIGSYKIEPGQPLPLAVPLAALPVKSVGAPSAIEIIGVTAEDGIDKRIVSETLHVGFSDDFMTAYVSGIDSYGPLVAAALRGNLRDPRIQALMGASAASSTPTISSPEIPPMPSPTDLLALVAKTTGKMRGDNGEELPLEGSASADSVSTRSVLLAFTTPQLPKPTNPPVPQQPVSVTFCATLDVSFTDSGYGEDYLVGGRTIRSGGHSIPIQDPVPARYATVSIRTLVAGANGDVLGGGGGDIGLDKNGCGTAPLSPGKYWYSVKSRVGDKAPNNFFEVYDKAAFDIRHVFQPYRPSDYNEINLGIPDNCKAGDWSKGVFGNSPNSWDGLPYPTDNPPVCAWNDEFTGSFTVPGISAIQFSVTGGANRSAFRVAAVAGQILSTGSDGGLQPNWEIQEYVDSVGTNLGRGPTAAHYGVWWVPGEKVSIAGTIGKQVRSLADHSFAQASDERIDPNLTPFCQCPPSRTPGVTVTHALQSRNSWQAANIHAWEHFYAARTFNDLANPSCTFMYGERVFFKDAKYYNPPFKVRCDQPAKWMETYCLAPNDSTEWDQLTFLRSLESPRDTGYLNIQDILAIHTSASASGAVTWNSFRNAALAQFGGIAANVRYRRVFENAHRNGVDH